MKGLSFRRRLTVWSTLLAAAVLLIAALGAAIIVYRGALSELDTTMRAETKHFFSEMGRHGAANFDWTKIDNEMREWMPPEVPPRMMELRTIDGTVRYRSAGLRSPGFMAETPGLRMLPRGHKTLRLLVTEQDGIIFAMATDLDETEALVRDLLLSLAAVLPVALGFAWFGSRWLAAKAVKPVEEITTAAESVTAERLDRRVPVPAVRDEMQRLATVLNATFDRLERSYAQALRFSADASHELKTPLTVLRASIEAVLESPSLEDADRLAIAGLLEHTHRLTNITSSLLLLARADAGRLVLESEEHDIAALVEACAEDARIVVEDQKIQVLCDLPAEARERVDALRFAQIVSNLLANAVKYNRAGGEVRVTLVPAGSTWRLTVANTGPGIAPAYRARLFERFFRAEHTAEVTGQGLGLSLARELARAHGGDIALVRSDAEWTEFTVTLPKTILHEVPANAAPAAKISTTVTTNPS
jgi:two-component system heavy metal sensor histidine kinase CusS